jgi:hypothetical protein
MEGELQVAAGIDEGRRALAAGHSAVVVDGAERLAELLAGHTDDGSIRVAVLGARWRPRAPWPRSSSPRILDPPVK